MSYQALARQYRPQNFTELVGQEHVSQALINGLEQDRVHHAFLFTGTRGVGKTTVARILAKALNCETGVTGNPCGVCGACTEITEGRFVDLIEVDAASRTGVDDTRELLENVQYAPTKGRYKIYLIDEVHMFSNSSFNALLKTLEEPPPHVKFLLATTEPKKLPVTVLSRCLQFNLKRLNLSQIKDHLIKLLELQKAEFDHQAVELIARAADGSMRDGLSLLDQSLAFGAGKVLESDVKLMLGTMDQDKVVGLLHSILDKNAESLSAQLEQIFVMSPDYSRFLHELAYLLHEISLIQILNKVVDGSPFDRPTLDGLLKKTNPEQIQLFYQIVIKGQEEIKLAPDSKTGFEMTIIRLFAFKIGNPSKNKSTVNTQSNTQAVNVSKQNSPLSASSNQNNQAVQNEQITQSEISQTELEPPAEIEKIQTEIQSSTKTYSLADINNDNWQNIYAELPIKGMSKVLARNAHVVSNQSGQLVLAIDKQAEAFMTDSAQNKLCGDLENLVNETISVKLEDGVDLDKTIAKKEQDIVEKNIQQTKQQVNENSFVQHMQENFDAEVIQIKQGQNFLEV
ncbi:MAG: DNA polymerase III subunit gamma/tau [Proteobacteria bacterium]|nr:DNA polymerase III subunit gamma/tau [Pseudomonadota bacterium]